MIFLRRRTSVSHNVIYVIIDFRLREDVMKKIGVDEFFHMPIDFDERENVLDG